MSGDWNGSKHIIQTQSSKNTNSEKRCNEHSDWMWLPKTIHTHTHTLKTSASPLIFLQQVLGKRIKKTQSTFKNFNKPRSKNIWNTKNSLVSKHYLVAGWLLTCLLACFTQELVISVEFLLLLSITITEKIKIKKGRNKGEIPRCWAIIFFCGCNIE